jgi:type III restriction enzyme
LGNITIEEVKKSFARFKPLPLGAARDTEIEYEGRHLFTGEIVEQMKIKLPLLESGFGAIAFYREQLERICQLRGTHAKLAPLLQKFLTEILFQEKVSLTDQRLITRLADADVREHIHATFVPLIRSKTTITEERVVAEPPKSVVEWKPFQVTHSERHPTVIAEHTPFNLIPCNRELEVAFTNFADRAPDIAAFCKNAGPQALRIDYLATGSRLAFYTPDFLVRKTDGSYLLVETKGREDIDVPAKARAAIAWCESASQQGTQWEYLYLPEKVFFEFRGNRLADLARACEPARADLLHEANEAQMVLPFYEITAEQKAERVEEFIPAATLEQLPSRYRKSVEEAVALFKFLENKGASLSPCFTPLLGTLDEAAKGMIVGLLEQDMPTGSAQQRAYFAPTYSGLSDRDRQWLSSNAPNLKKTLVFKNGVMPLGLLAFCFEYARSGPAKVGGVFLSVRQRFAPFKDSPLAGQLNHIKDFRNTYVAHQEHELLDLSLARTELKNWINGLAAIYHVHHGSELSA